MSDANPVAGKQVVGLVLLSGDIEIAKDEIARLYPNAQLEIIRRSEIESGSFSSRLNALRKRRPDVLTA